MNREVRPSAPGLPNAPAAPHSQMRRYIAARLSEAKRTIPHFYLDIDCEIDRLLSLRSRLNQAAVSSDAVSRVSLNDLLIKAWAISLEHFPEAHVSWTDENMLNHTAAAISVAVAVPGGLTTPVVREAARKSVYQIGSEMKDFATRASQRRLKLMDCEGATSSLSNLGVFGIRRFSGIINPPQATLLGVGAAEKRIVVKSDAPSVATMLSCCLSVDHRALDGAPAAKLLGHFKKLLENPDSWGFP